MGERAESCVIFNPAAGKGQARRLIDRACRDCPKNIRLLPTESAGHAEELARAAATDGFTVVIAAGGDGTVHEVANGLLRSDRPEVVLSVWPIGSANDYAFTLGLCAWWKGHRAEPLEVRLVDVGRLTAGGRSRFFVNGLGLNFNASVTLESRRISWLRGMPLYALAMLKALWRQFRKPLMGLRFDGLIREMPTLALTVNIGQREGNFPLTPRAEVDDGLFDVVHAGPLLRWDLIRYLPGMATGNLPTRDPRIWQGRCREVEVRSSEPVPVHLDGEIFCRAEEGISQFQIELLPKRLQVQAFPARSGGDRGV
jgi:diacylglycerol kinase family enzyme